MDLGELASLKLYPRVRGSSPWRRTRNSYAAQRRTAIVGMARAAPGRPSGASMRNWPKVRYLLHSPDPPGPGLPAQRWVPPPPTATLGARSAAPPLAGLAEDICSPGSSTSAMVAGGLGCPGCMRPAGAAITKVVLPRAASLRSREPPEAYRAVPRRVRGRDGQIRSR